MKKLLLSVLMVMLAMPALAFEIPMPDGMSLKMYGQVRMNAVYDYKNVSNGRTNDIGSDFKMNWQPNSRFGINFSVGNFFANAEMNVKPDQINSPIGFRQFYGGYTFENGLTLIAGNKTTLAGTKISNTVWYTDGGLAGFGAADDTRRPMIMVSYAGLDFAVVANGVDKTANITIPGFSAAEEYIPRFEVAYNLKFDNFTGKIAGTYGLYTFDRDADAKRFNVHAWHVGLTGKYNFGNMYAGVSAFYGMNSGMYGAANLISGGATAYQSVSENPTIGGNSLGSYMIDGDSVEDVSTWGATVVFGVNISEMLALEVGGGWQQSYADFITNDNGDKTALNGYGVYVQAPIKFAEGHFVITPEVGYFGRMADFTGAAIEELLAGAQVKVLF